MARANTVTKLSLDSFFSILGLHPLHMNQIVVESLAPANGCGSPLVQYAWQASDRVGRDDIAQAIATAEDMLESYMGFRLKPTWEVDERASLYSFRLPGPIKTNWGHVIAMSTRAFDLVEDDADVTYTDRDGDGYKETATISVDSGPILNQDEVQLYYPGHAGSAEWEIRPIQVSILGGTATITCRREQLVAESILENYSPRAADGLVDGDFLATVDVYREYYNPGQQLQLLYIGRGCNCIGVNMCSVCTLTGEFGYGIIRDARNGLVDAFRGEWDAGASAWAAPSCGAWSNPSRVRLWYRGGWRDPSLTRPLNNMARNWERAVTYLAVTLLDRPLCGCETVENMLKYWSDDLGESVSADGGSSSHKLTADQIGNPFGTSRGAIYAYNLARREKIGEAVCVR